MRGTDGAGSVTQRVHFCFSSSASLCLPFVAAEVPKKICMMSELVKVSSGIGGARGGFGRREGVFDRR